MVSDNFLTLCRGCRIFVVLCGACAVLFSGTFFAQSTARKAAAAPGNPEQRAGRAFDVARANPLDLHAFLVRMPKGADLHYHFSGGIYAESFIRAAAEDGLCVDLASLSFTKPVASAQSAPDRAGHPTLKPSLRRRR